MNNTEFYEKHLRAFPESNVLLDHEDVPFFGSLPELLRSVRNSFGLDIVFVRAGARLPDVMARCFTVKVDGGKSPGNLVLLPDKVSSGGNVSDCGDNGDNIDNIGNSKIKVNVGKVNIGGGVGMSSEQKEEFVNSLALLLGDAYRWQQMVRKYEEELASIVPISRVRQDEVKFSESLFNILKSGSKLLSCQASSFYVFNADDKTLKLRSCWGLPEERLLDAPRLLHESLADLEAMLGQAVILNEDYLFETWQCPESFPAAICVPVMSPVTIIGTLWFFSDLKRNFIDRDRYLIEIIAGRISSELERAALERELTRKNAG
ncbi:MAG: GAF domain-containing protein [Planctomycetaceae bacterium]|jgi:hypothetical protein|nr:GAF domain-containing protein [Planctomycetaceae bacterium]